MALYVEIAIEAPLEEVWRRTQTPELHERWDLRFTSITFLARAADGEPQRFRYATRIGGLEVVGWGETVAAKDLADGGRTSALRFGSDDPRAIIRAGSGYWRYTPLAGGGTRFVTGYDYEPRWGRLGRAADAVAFRPLLGWATAWSFDRLRLWCERGLDPAAAARAALVHAIATAGVAFTFAWHGLVPKLLGPHPSELALLADAGIGPDAARHTVLALGAAELAFGLAFPFLARRAWPWIATLAAMAAALVGVAATSPHALGAAFGPVTLNALCAALAAVGLALRRDLPSARRCRRREPARRGDESREEPWSRSTNARSGPTSPGSTRASKSASG